MTLTARAAYAVVCFALIGIRRSRAAKIIAKREAGEAEVFCIEIEDAHCYYANGVLVSNCDAHQYMCLAMGEGHALVSAPVKPYQRQPRPRAREF